MAEETSKDIAVADVDDPTSEEARNVNADSCASDSTANSTAALQEGYEWDPVRRGFFPKIDEDFIAYYQASYGFVEEDGEVKPAPVVPAVLETDQQVGSGVATATVAPADAPPPVSEEKDEEEKEGAPPSTPDDTDAKKADQSKKRKPNDPAWYQMEEGRNNNVYVTGLPLEYSEQEFYDLMSKCGIVKDEEDTEEPKIKLYHADDGSLKGDGRCCYLKQESVALSLQILDGSMVGDNVISVQRAVFERRGEFNAGLRKKKKPKKKNKKSAQEKLLGWNEPKKGPMRKKQDKIIVFRHCFHPSDFEEDACLITDIRDEIRAECEKCGPVHKVLVFDRHPQGVLSVAFKDFDGADGCIALMNGRWYGGRQLDVFAWDGVTSYQIEETDLERVDRLKKWEDFIATDDDKPDASSSETG